MKNFLVLKLLEKFRFLFKLTGVNFYTMLSILKVKLTMDQRRVPTLMAAQEPKEGNYFLKSLLPYFIIGMFMVFFIFLPTPIFFTMNLVYGLTLFMLITTMISDFSSVLLDVTEKDILLSKPVDHKTLNLAKIMHILIYLLTLLLVMCGPIMIAGTVRYGFVFLSIFFVQLFFIAGFSIFITSVLYFLILRFFNSERLKDIINYFQIGFSVAMVVGFQLIGRAYDFVDIEAMFTVNWYNFLIPTAWYSAPYALLFDDKTDLSFIWLSVLGVFSSILFIFTYIKFVAPYFEKNLSKLNDNSGTKKISVFTRIFKRWASLICINKTEKVFYIFTKRLIGGERNFKLRMYPNLALGAFFPLIFLLNNVIGGESIREGIQAMKGGNYFLYMYFSIILFSSSLSLLATSDSYKAAWMYRVIPTGPMAYIHSGAVKSLIIQYILPAFMIASSFFILVIGASSILNLLLIFLNTVFIILVLFNISDKHMPFTLKFQDVKTNQTMQVLTTIGTTLVLLLIHLISLHFKYSVMAYILLMVAVNKVYWKKTFDPEKFFG
ncbi:hypothetical protein PRVXH_000763 [Proteinivorax hydrogeniformans]|uniref:ABC-2 type transport system permease protein n=1 Tax=Proteinivorax hydrogeniformans TaxID=1826727 RepID=A0AAU8HVP2_9FIRM